MTSELVSPRKRESKLSPEQADPDRESANARNGNGTRPKTVVSDAAGEAGINVPGDRRSTFEPKIVNKRQRRVTESRRILPRSMDPR